MTRKYWTDDELSALWHGFEFHVGLPWSDAVNLAASAGSSRVVPVTPEQWAHVAAIVGTRTGDQCAKRLQTERRQEQERRAAISAAEPPDHWDVRPASVPKESTRIVMNLAPRPGSANGIFFGIDPSPYVGQASGRIVLSFNGRGAA